jgi:hypothetical protein
VVVDPEGEPSSTGPLEMNSVFSNTQTQYGADCMSCISNGCTSGLLSLRFFACRMRTVSLPLGGPMGAPVDGVAGDVG